MLGFKLTDRIPNTALTRNILVTQIFQKAAQLNWDWAGHVCRIRDDFLPKMGNGLTAYHTHQNDEGAMN